MSTTVSTPKKQSVSNSSDKKVADALEFQVDRVGHPRRRLRLVGHSYTFGSGTECSVRLEDPSLRDVHAILIRQDDRILVRGYGIAILVNNIAVAEASLEQGDRFQLGEYEFTLASGAGTYSPVVGSEPVAASPQQTADSSPSHASLSAEITGAVDLGRISQSTRFIGPQRLSFADGMRLVAQQPSLLSTPPQYDTRFPSYQDSRPKEIGPKERRPKPSTRGAERQTSSRIRRLEQIQRDSLDRADAAYESSVASTQAVEALADRLDSLFGQLTDMSGQQRAAEEESKHSIAFDQLNERLNVLQTAVDEATKEAREYRVRHEESLARIAQLEIQLESAIKTHEERQKSWELEAESLRQSINALTSHLNEAQSEIVRQQEKAAALEQDLVVAKEELTQEQDATKALETDLETAESKARQHLEKIAELEQELALAISGHEARQQAWESEAKELTATIERLSGQLAATETQRVEMATALQESSDNANDRESENALSQQLAETQARLQQLESNQSAQTSGWQIEREELEYKIASQAAELSQISALQAAASSEVDDCKVADRLAQRLEAEVNRLHQDQNTDPLDQARSFQSGGSDFETDAASDSELQDIGSTFVLGDDPSAFASDEAPAFGTESLAEVETESYEGLGAQVEGASDSESDYGPESFAAEFSEALADLSDSVNEDDAESELAVSPYPEEAFGYGSELDSDDDEIAFDSDPTVADFDQVETEYSERDQHENVYEDVTNPEGQSDYSDQLRVKDVDDSELEDVSSTFVMGEGSGLQAETSPKPQDFEEAATEDDYGAFGFGDSDQIQDNAYEPSDSEDLSDAEPLEERMSGGLDTEAYSGLAEAMINEMSAEREHLSNEAFGVETPVSEAYYGGLEEEAPGEQDISSTMKLGGGSHLQESALAGEEPYYGEASESDPDSHHNKGSYSHDHEAAEGTLPDGELEDDGYAAHTQQLSDYPGSGYDEEPEDSGYDHLAYDNSEVDQPAPVAQAAPTPEASVDSAGGEEDSIEDYMNRLLQRMHGDSGEADTESAHSSTSLASSEIPADDYEHEAYEETEEDHSVMDEADYVPRSTAPEKSQSLVAMRELANNSARQAIATSVRSRQRTSAIFKLIVAIAFMIGAGVCAFLSQTLGMFMFLGTAACVVLAIVFAIEGMKKLKGPAFAPQARPAEPPQQELPPE